MSIPVTRTLREQMRQRPVFGPFSKSTDPAFVEAAGLAGFDFVILDLEHGPNHIANLHNLVRAAVIGGAAPIVRVAEGAEWQIGAALDAGASGVQIPHVSTADAATEMVARAKFGAGGHRGVCRYVRAADYSLADKGDYLAKSNETLVIVQVEGSEGVANLGEIVAVDGVDVVFVGPYDLSQSLGVPGEVDHPRVVEAVQAAVREGEQHGVAVGTFTDTGEAARRWADAGVRYVSYRVDVGIFAAACQSAVLAFRQK